MVAVEEDVGKRALMLGTRLWFVEWFRQALIGRTLLIRLTRIGIDWRVYLEIRAHELVVLIDSHRTDGSRMAPS